MMATNQARWAEPPPRDRWRQFEELRAREYSRLDRLDHVYLDYTGGGLYADSQPRAHLALLEEAVFGNPHSASPTSLASAQLIEQTRAGVLEFFRASPDEYAVIFTANTSAALKLVGEAYPFAQGRFLLTYDNHNSVNGLREFARRAGAALTYLPVDAPELRVDPERLRHELERPHRRGHRLFAFPAQSNFSGVQHPLEWVELAHERGWDVLVDAAAFVPTHRLDLSRYHPDFVALSFYKMFGYPTGIGCLLARRPALARLRRPWFAGGTVWGVSVSGGFHVLLEGGEAFEDGTLNYLDIPAVDIGLGHLDSVGIDSIREHTMALTGLMLAGLQALRHGDGSPLVEIYGPHDVHARGPTVAFNFLDPAGRPVDERIVERSARARGISLRTGCLCNPGGFESAWNVTPEMYKAFRPRGWKLIKALFDRDAIYRHMSLQDYIDKLGLRNGGAVRASLGIASNRHDVSELLAFAASFRDCIPDASDLPPRLRC